MAQICDFEIARVIEENDESTTSKTVSGDAVRYSAPELITKNDAPPTKESDAYSFGMLILECITEKRPFHYLSRDAMVIYTRIDKKQSPPRPDGPAERNRVSEDLWGLMGRCWSLDPQDRPTMENIHSFFLNNQ